MKEYIEKITELSEKITDIAKMTNAYYSQNSALASMKDIDKLADELKKVVSKALEPPF